MFKVKVRFNIDAIATLVGKAAMNDHAYKNECAAKRKKFSTKLTCNLQSLDFTVLNSHGNFVLATPPKGNAEQLYLQLKAQGILVRYFKQPGLDNKLRITVGTEQQNQTLLEALQIKVIS